MTIVRVKSCSHVAPSRQEGQTSVFVAVTIVIILLAALLLYNVGQLTSGKMELQNAADSTAYSGAVMVARAYNFAAYSNRAMVANQVAIAQIVGLTSWSRYYCTIYNQKCGKFPTSGSTGAYTEITDEIKGYFNGELTPEPQIVFDTYGPASKAIYTAFNVAAGPLIDTLNGIEETLSVASKAYYDATYLDLLASLAGQGTLNTILKANDPHASLSPFGGITLGTDIALSKKFITTYTPLNNKNDPNNRFHNVVVQSLDPFSNGRSGALDYTETLPFPLVAAGSCLGDGDGFFLMGAIYQGSTTLANNNASWSAKDSANFVGGGICIIEVPTPVGDIPIPIPLIGYANDSNQAYTGKLSSNSMSATYKVGTYSGLRSYLDVSNLKKADMASPILSLFVQQGASTLDTTEYATSALGAPQGTAQQGSTPVLNLTDAEKGSKMGASASSAAYFARPLQYWLLDGKGVYGSLFNPYWEAHLVPTPLALQAAAAAVQ